MKFKMTHLLGMLVAIFFGIKCIDGVAANLVESTIMLVIFSLLVLKLNRFHDVGGGWNWARKHWCFGGVLIFSYVSMLGQLLFLFINKKISISDVVTLEIQAMLFFSACISLGFWIKEKVFSLFEKNKGDEG